MKDSELKNVDSLTFTIVPSSGPVRTRTSCFSDALYVIWPQADPVLMAVERGRGYDLPGA